jgi:putative ABC transport system permease protein
MGYQDLRVAARVLAKNPLPTALSVLSIAFGIGLTTGVFSLADAFYLRPLAISRPGELLTVISVGDDGSPFMYGWQDYEDMRRSGPPVSAIAAYQRRGGMLANEEGGSDQVLVSPATPDFFAVVGVKAALGRARFETAGERPAAVLGWRLWQRRFGGDRGIIGKTIVLSGKPLAVAAVMPPEFGGLERGVANDIWVSADTWFDVLRRGSRQDRADQFEFVVRLNRGASAPAAAAQLDASIRGPGKRKPAPAGTQGTRLEASFAPGLRDQVLTGGGLMAVLMLVLFVACANVAQLRMAQAEARRKETGMRMALGAGRGRIAGQLLLETGLLAVPGAALGLLIAHALLAKAIEFLTMGQAYVDPGIRLDTRVLAFTIAATLISVLMAGMPPARFASRLDISEVLKSEQGSTGGRTGWRRRFLIAAQAAIGIALFGSTLLMLQSLRSAAAIRPGLDPSKKLLLLEAVPGLKLSNVEWAEQACERLAALPGARAATYARRLPLSESGGGATVRVEMQGQAPRAVKFNNVGGSYFAVMGTRVVAGRGIDTNDRPGTEPVTVVSESFARQFLAGRNPLGQWIRARGKTWHVVGVAQDAPSNDLHEPIEPYLYFAYAQNPMDDITLVLETAGEPSMLARAMTSAIRQFDSRALLYGQRTLREQMDAALANDRLITTAASTLGLFSLGLLAAGIFGVLQYAVTERRRELGLRVALGATPRAIEGLVLGETLRIALFAIPPGLGLLKALTVAARSAIPGAVPAGTPLYASSAVAVFAIMLASAWIPARRATRIDAMEALRMQ